MSATNSTPKGVTLTVVVNAHSEGALLRPTLRSIERAIREVAARGLDSELLIVLDNPDAATRAEAEYWRNKGISRTRVTLLDSAMGDAGASRNVGAENARGTFVAFCDGDDLVSYNYFVAALEELERRGPEERLVLHPETVLSFGARSLVWKIPSSKDVDYLDLIGENQWPSSSIARKDVYMSTPYRSLDPTNGFGPEDYFWNIETSIAGISHEPVSETIFFYRVRESGGVNNRHAHSVLPAFDLEALRRALPTRARAQVDPTSEEILSVPPRNLLVRTVTHDFQVMRNLVRRALQIVVRRARRIFRFVTRHLVRATSHIWAFLSPVVRSAQKLLRGGGLAIREGLRSAFLKAFHISKRALQPMVRRLPPDRKDALRRLLISIWERPFAPAYWISGTRSLESTPDSTPSSVGEQRPASVTPDRLEQTPRTESYGSSHSRDDLLLEAARIEPSISWTALDFDGWPRWQHADETYARVLDAVVTQIATETHALVMVPWVGVGGADLVSLNYARAFKEAFPGDGQVTMLATFDPSKTIRELVPNNVRFVQMPPEFRGLDPTRQRRLLAQALILVEPHLVVSVNCFDLVNTLKSHWPALTLQMKIYATLFAFDKIGPGFPTNPITDDSQREFLSAIDGLITDNTVTAGTLTEMLALPEGRIHVHHQPAFVDNPILATSTRAFNDSVFDSVSPFRVLWPHRLDREKRPDALLAVARIIREQDLPVVIEVYGQTVLSEDGGTLLQSLQREGIRYHGPYSGGLATLPTHEYHAILLTSEWEGLPLVLVQAMLLGLPVVSTAVGGVVDLVRHGESGFLVDSPEDAGDMVEAIRILLRSREMRRKMIRLAYRHAMSQHGWEAFLSRTLELTGASGSQGREGRSCDRFGLGREGSRLG